MQQHYYSKEQSSQLKIKHLVLNIRGISLNLQSSTGIFSKKAVDKGTLALIENMVINPGWQILDLGSGYGAVGLVAGKLAGCNPYLIDINKRACMLAKQNARHNNIIAKVLNGNLYEPVNNQKFDTILVNPPQTAGKSICFAMIEGAKEHLKNHGLLQLVARPNKGGNTLANKMEEVFGNMQIIGRRSGYAVYVSKKIS